MTLEMSKITHSVAIITTSNCIIPIGEPLRMNLYFVIRKRLRVDAELPSITDCRDDSLTEHVDHNVD